MTIDVLCPGLVDTSFHTHHHYVNSRANTAPPSQGGAHTFSSSSPFKMTVQRCVQLMLLVMEQRQGRAAGAGLLHVWMAPQPALTAMYLHQYAPRLSQWMLQKFVGPKRVALWRDGLDLYDPASWKKKK